jgi:hypothetical protein
MSKVTSSITAIYNAPKIKKADIVECHEGVRKDW